MVKCNYTMEQINEGLKYFQYSPKIKKYVREIKEKALFVENPDARQNIVNYVVHLEEVLKEFQAAEDLFSSGKKKEARLAYKQAKVKYSSTIKKINAEGEGRKALIQFLGYTKYFLIMQLFSIAFRGLGGAIGSIVNSKSPPINNLNIPVSDK